MKTNLTKSYHTSNFDQSINFQIVFPDASDDSDSLSENIKLYRQIQSLQKENKNLKDDLFQERYKARYYESFHKKSVEKRKQIQEEYETTICNLKKEYQKEKKKTIR